MAQIDFNSINQGGGNYDNNIGFFSLKNDGDEAIVRFMQDDISDFELLTVHEIELNGKKRKINCIREPQDGFDKCPICARGESVRQRFFIHLIQYVFDPNTGAVIAQPKIWERSAQYAFTLKGFIDEYGPLSNCIFKIKRQGAAGSKDTSYMILPCDSSRYDPNVYVKDENAFRDYKVLGSFVLNKTFDEINTYYATGNFPKKDQQGNGNVNNQFNNIPNNIPVQNNNPVMADPLADVAQFQNFSNQPAPNVVQQQFTQAPPVTPDAQYVSSVTPQMSNNNQFNNFPNNSMQQSEVVQRPVRSYN